MAEISLVTRAAAQTLEQGGTVAASGASAMVQTLLWLMVVVGLILALAWLARRVGGVHFQNAAGLKMLSVLAVGNKEKIALVQAGDKQLLIGIAPGGINTLHVFDEPVQALPAAASPLSCVAGADDGSASLFQQLLAKAVARKHP